MKNIQCLMRQWDKGINQDKSAFIPFSTSAPDRGDKGINPYKVYPVSHPGIAGAV